MPDITFKEALRLLYLITVKARCIIKDITKKEAFIWVILIA